MSMRMNFGSKERWLRVVVGIVMIAAGLLYFWATIIGQLGAFAAQRSHTLLRKATKKASACEYT